VQVLWQRRLGEVEGVMQGVQGAGQEGTCMSSWGRLQRIHAQKT
jgi:hypothetical protein